MIIKDIAMFLTNSFISTLLKTVNVNEQLKECSTKKNEVEYEEPEII